MIDLFGMCVVEILLVKVDGLIVEVYILLLKVGFVKKG